MAQEPTFTEVHAARMPASVRGTVEVASILAAMRLLQSSGGNPSLRLALDAGTLHGGFEFGRG